MAKTSFGLPANNIVAAVVAGGYTSGSGVINLVAGQGAQFPALGANQFYRLTVIQNSVAYSALATPSNFTIFKATGLTTDQFTGVTAIEGTTDRNYVSADVVDVRVTAGSLTDIQTAVNTLEGQYGNQGITTSTNTLASNVTLSVVSSAYAPVGVGSLFLSIPGAGTYFVGLTIRVLVYATTSDPLKNANSWILTQLYNATAAAFITSPSTICLPYYNALDKVSTQLTTSFNWLITFAGAATVQLYASPNWSGAATVTPIHQVLSDSSGATSLTFVRLA